MRDDLNTLETASGVLGAVLTTYVTVEDVKKLLGCKNSKAYMMIKEINKVATEAGNMAYEHGKANKYLFAEKFGIPMDVVNAVIETNKGGYKNVADKV